MLLSYTNKYGMLAEKRKKMNVFHIHKASNFLAVFAACLLQALRLT